MRGMHRWKYNRGLPLERKILIVYITSILLIEVKAEEILENGSGSMARIFA